MESNIEQSAENDRGGKRTQVTIRETHFPNQTVVDIVHVSTGEVLMSDSFSGRWGGLDYQRGWWMEQCEAYGWEMVDRG